jgi:hypothetical protein
MNQIPKNAICNGYSFGETPEILSRLTDIELAFLTPVKTHGYCISYTGGLQKQLKGTLLYYKVQHNSIARAAAHFDVLGMSDNIVVLLYGKMTPSQRERARSKNKLRTHYILEALEWLCKNNKEWKKLNINVAEISNRLQNPTLIDNSTEVASEVNNNVEDTESIQIFFPDATIDVSRGGHERR